MQKTRQKARLFFQAAPTCIGNGNSGENPNRFKRERARKRAQGYFALHLVRKNIPPKPSSKSVALLITGLLRFFA